MKRVKKLGVLLALFVFFISIAASVLANPTAALTPDPALENDDLTCSVVMNSAYLNYYWYMNSVKQDHLTTYRTTARSVTISSVYTSQGDTWTCEVISHPSGTLSASDSVYIEVVDAVNATILPDPAYTNSDLLCNRDVTSPYHEFKWYLNSVLQPDLTNDTVSSSNTTIGQTWTCEVVHSLVSVTVGSDNITISNAPPIANPVANQTPLEGTSVNIVLTGYDSDPGDVVTFAINTAPTNGIISNFNGTTGFLTYTPNPGFDSTDSFSFIATDGTTNSTPETVIINVIPLNDAPVANDVFGNTNEDIEAFLTLSYVDVDTGDYAETCSVTNVNGGSITQACACISGICTVGLTPLANSIQTITADYWVNDGGLDSNVAKINVTVNSINDAPIASDVVDNTDEDTEINITLPYIEVDLGDYADTCGVTNINGGSITQACACISGICTVGLRPTDNSTSDITASYTVNDGTVNSNTASLTITINNINDAPYFDFSFVNWTLDEGQILSYDIDASDVDVNDVLTFTSGVTSLGGSIDANTGLITWTLSNSNVGNHSISVTVCDNSGAPNACITDSFFVTVNSINLIASSNGPYVADEGTQINFISNAFGGSGPYQFRWDLDNDGIYETPGQNPSYTWTDEYNSIIVLQVNDSVGNIVTSSTTVTVNNVVPIVNSNGHYSCLINQNINLIGSAIDPGNDVLTYSWDTDGDSTFETPGQNINYACNNYGNNTISIMVDDGDGGIDVDSTYVLVSAPTFIISANGPYTAAEGSAVLFSASASGGLAPYQFRWDTDGDGNFDTPWSSNSDTSYTWDDEHTGTAVVEVMDSLGTTLQDTASVTISNAVPTVSANGPYTCLIGENVILMASASDPGNDVLTYSWDLDNDYSYEINGQSTTFPCVTNGNYPINLRVDDGDSGVGLDTTYVLVNIPPISVEAYGPYSGSEGFATNFIGSALGGLTPYQYRWDFNNDGIWDTAWSSAADASAAFTDDYSGLVILEVMDSVGIIAMDSAVIDVSNLPPTAGANGPYTCSEGENLSLTGSAADYGNDTFTYAWDLDDDSIFETSGQNAFYTCGLPGLYMVNLNVTDDDGGFDIDSAVINVGSAPDTTPPTITINSPEAIVYNTMQILLDISVFDGYGVDMVWYNINNYANYEYAGPVDLTYAGNGIYTLNVFANDTNGNLASSSVTFTISENEIVIEKPKPKYRAKVEKIRLNNGGFLSAGDDLRITISLSNTGAEDLENTRIAVIVPELGIWRKIGPIDLDKGDKTTREIVLKMPNGVEPGEYIARIVVSNSKTKRVVHRHIIIE